jgi:iron complex outermembrane receptor protein
LLRNYENLNLIFGGAFNKYDGDHFGEVIWAQYGSTSNKDKFYDNTGNKIDFNVYAKADYSFGDNWSLYADIQYRNVNYKVKGIDEGPVPINFTDNHNFFNPKVGINYFLDNSNFYLSYARANKEPKRSDYEAKIKPKAESLDDFELGWKYNTDKFILNSNIYFMNYKDQLVLTGELDDVGNPIATNIGKSYRLGLEVESVIKIFKTLSWQPNLALSINKNLDKHEEFDGELIDFGNTDLSYSPNIILGSNLLYKPIKHLKISFLSKYVGKQFMSNIEHIDSKLDDYFVNDLHLNYEIKSDKFFKSIVFSGLVNNIFNVKYVSNGYFFTYDDTWTDPNNVKTITGTGYYPQAEINFLLGVNLKF